MKTNTLEDHGCSGLFCINCLPSNAICLNSLCRSDLERVHLREYSLFKNQKRGEFVDYYRFLDELKAMIGLKYEDGLLPNQKPNGVARDWQCSKKASGGKQPPAAGSYSIPDFYIDILALPKMPAWHRKRNTQSQD